MKLKKTFLVLIRSLLLAVLFAGCFFQKAREVIRKSADSSHEKTTDTDTDTPTKRPPEIKAAFMQGDEDSDNIIFHLSQEGTIELRHIIDPKTGRYEKKVTIPKNYSGLLSLSGQNLVSLKDRFIRVRFRFGHILYPVVIKETSIGSREGITPSTEIHLLTLDLRDKPFENIRLRYDLFDYNDYWDENGGGETKTPVSDPKDRGLFCRGLRLQHDPTFKGSSTNYLCDEAREKCLYAYAKIEDRGLVDEETNFSLIPTRPQIDSTGRGYAMEDGKNLLLKCLPDSSQASDLDKVLNLQGLSHLREGTRIYHLQHTKSDKTVTSIDDALEDYFLEKSYLYKGPFRALDRDRWEISGKAIFSPVSGPGIASGLFQSSLGSQKKPDAGYNSFLFQGPLK